PWALNETLPRMLPVRLTLKIWDVTLARVPFECAIADSIATVAWPAYTEYGSGALPWFAFVNDVRNALPAPFSCEFGRPATLTNAPSAAAPAPWTTAEIGVNPSGRNSCTFGP